MAHPTSTQIDTAISATGTPAPSVALANALLKDFLTYLGTQVATRAKTGAFTFALADAAPLAFVDSNSASAIIGTVPPNATVAFPTGTVINLCRRGAGDFTIAAGAGVTISKPTDRAMTLRAQWSMAMLRKIDTNVWILGGDLT